MGHKGWLPGQCAGSHVASPFPSSPRLLVVFVSLKQAELLESV